MIVSYSYGGIAQISRGLGIPLYHYRKHKLLLRQGKELSVIINWGLRNVALKKLTDAIPADQLKPILNAKIDIAGSKVATFRALDHAGINHPYVYGSAQEAQESGDAYLARKDNLMQGRGIVYCEPGYAAPIADFYVRYIPRRREVRIHVWDEKVIITQRKDIDPNQRICNRRAGARFVVYPLGGYIGPQNALRANEMAVAAVKAVGLDFGAVDILYGEDRTLYVLEVNTAPAIEAESVKNTYTNILKGYIL